MAEGGTWTQRLERAWLERSVLSRLLLPLSWCLGFVAALHRWLYRIGWLRSGHPGVPVIVVGNLVAGGAGKTPTVLAIMTLVRRLGFEPGIVSRGYGRRADAVVDVEPETPVSECGDEPLLLRLRCGAPVCVARDRLAAARELRRRHPRVNVIVSDDGLQHLRLARDLQVIVFDERGVGNGWLLPAGPLREPLPAAVSPHTFVVYNASAPSTPLTGTLARRQLVGCIALAAWWQGQPAAAQDLQALRGTPVLAAAGVARPQRFFDMLRAHGLSITELPLPDHFDFATLPWPPGSHDVIVTEKDAVKIHPDRICSTRVWVAALDFALDAGFETAFANVLGPAPTALSE